ncbi:tRNA lysidine(34) synthetase TilS [candidate division KSB1 bacterium]|nr:tRNA lysidine(34) synthetase TilS [candidate division KSB1 bacterium]
MHKGEKVGLAVSGGLDSVVLFDLFCRMQPDWRLHLQVLHFNHKLRPEAAHEADFVAGLCERAGICFAYDEQDVASFAAQKKISIEMAARECRYAFFDRAVARHHLDRIATAHTANDQAETVLAHIMRGTGLSGLKGIPVQRDHFIRPLLFAERAELHAYAAVHDLHWCEDATNRDVKFTRNRIRHKLLPFMQAQFNPQIIKSLNRLSESVLQSELIVQQAGLHAYEECVQVMDGRKIVLEIDRFLAYFNPLQRLVLQRVFDELGKNRQELSFNTFTGLMQFLRKRLSGSSFALDPEVLVVISGERAVFHRTTGHNHWRNIDRHPGQYDLWNGLFLEIKETPAPLRLRRRQKKSEYVDADLLAARLVVRSFKNGDSFYPVNGAGKRKLSDFFIDQKVTFADRREVPILESDGVIVWVCGLRLDDRFKITQDTTRVLKLTIGVRGRKNNF